MKILKSVKNKILSVIIMIVVFVFTLCSCSTNEEGMQTETFYNFMGTSVNVVVDAPVYFFWQKDKLQACYDEIEVVLDEIDSSFSVENTDSYVSKYNACSVGDSVEIDEEFAEIFAIAKEIFEASGGAFNPAVKQLVDLWAFSKSYSLDNYQPQKPFDRARNLDGSFDLPEEKFINAFIELAKFDCEIIEDKLMKSTKNVFVDDNEFTAQIDLSGVVKGYTSHKIKKIILDKGYTDFYVSIGSSSMYLSEIKGEAIELSITDPKNVENSSCSVKIQDKYVSTSGTYENSYAVGGEVYHHIIDASTGKPSTNDVVSVTVFGDDGAKADALSTAVVVLGKDEGIKLLNDCGYNYVILTKLDEIFTDMADNFSLINDDYLVTKL